MRVPPTGPLLDAAQLSTYGRFLRPTSLAVQGSAPTKLLQFTPTPPLAFDPAGELFPKLARFDPLTYEGSRTWLPWVQARERRLMHEGRNELTEAEKEAAVVLARVGTGELWTLYADQVAQHLPEARAARVREQVWTALTDAVEAMSAGKSENNAPRPHWVDHNLERFGPEPGGTSHPSGHSAMAYAAATVLANLSPDRAEEFYRAAANVARSRVICGVHYPGDIAAGSRLGLEVGMRQVRLQGLTPAAPLSSALAPRDLE